MTITHFYFRWPGFLALLVMIPVLAVAYRLMLRRKKKYALRYSSLALIYPALGKESRLRRHLPAALFLLALTSLLIVLARPTALVDSAGHVKTVLLVMDVSSSMNNDDILPSRLAAAERAALSFIEKNQDDTQIGLVAFANKAELVVPPTTDRDRLVTAIHSLTTAEGTAIGSSLLTALQAIPDDRPGQAAQLTQAAAGQAGSSARTLAPEIIILLTDGENNVGPQPMDAAQEAADRGVRVYTIGIGSPYGNSVKIDPSTGALIPVTGQESPGLGENKSETLRQIAELTHGKYYEPQTADELGKVFAGLSKVQTRSVEAQEISFLFIALGALLVCAAFLFRLAWHPLL